MILWKDFKVRYNDTRRFVMSIMIEIVMSTITYLNALSFSFLWPTGCYRYIDLYIAFTDLLFDTQLSCGPVNFKSVDDFYSMKRE